eukprot:Gb_06119 [translate_table: standard]
MMLDHTTEEYPIPVASPVSLGPSNIHLGEKILEVALIENLLGSLGEASFIVAEQPPKSIREVEALRTNVLAPLIDQSAKQLSGSPRREWEVYAWELPGVAGNACNKLTPTVALQLAAVVYGANLFSVLLEVAWLLECL